MNVRQKLLVSVFVICILLGLYIGHTKTNLGLLLNEHEDPARYCKVFQNIESSTFCDSPITASFPLLEQYGLNKPLPRPYRKLPVIVTGCDSSHFLESQGLLQSLHKNLRPKYPNYKLIYYDLGLTPTERAQLVKYCDCDVISFPFQNYPRHVKRLNNYAFKPIIIKIAMQEFGVVWWMDASIRIGKGDITSTLQQLFTDKVVFYKSWIQEPRGAPVWRTSPATFDFFNATPSFYLSSYEIMTGTAIFITSQETETVLRFWTTCALVEHCIAPASAKLSCPNIGKDVQVGLADVGQCHRYDQSVLNILLWRMFLDSAARRLPAWLQIRQGEKVQYFPET